MWWSTRLGVTRAEFVKLTQGKERQANLRETEKKKRRVLC